MACYHQRPAYRTPGGRLIFDSKTVATHRDEEFKLQINCGQCIGCKLERTRGWAIRSVHEAQMHEKNSFLTLTYSDEALPKDRSLQYDHWQKFAKKVRNHCGPFRFLHSGEYSPAPAFRPHYHALIFGEDWREERAPLQHQGNHELWTSPVLARLWPYGHHSIGALTFGSASYVASYCLKKLNGEYAKWENERVDEQTGEWWEVKPPYATMSRRPGLGSKWFDKYMADVYPSDECIVEGKAFQPPSYYDDKHKEREPEEHKKIEEKRRQQVQDTKDNHTEKRLRIREEIQQAKIIMKERK